MPVTKPAILKKELSRRAGHIGDQQAQNEAFISALCKALEEQLLHYYRFGKNSDSDDDQNENARLQRLGEISLMFRATSFKVGKRELEISAVGASGETIIDGSESQFPYSCPPGTQCIDGNCVPPF